MKKYYIKFISFLIIAFCLLSINFAQAGLLDTTTGDELDKQVEKFQLGAGFASGFSFGKTVAAVIKGFLALLGVIFVILIILAGYKWMMARGNDEQVKEAQDMIRRAIIGLIIIIGAYAITYFVFSYLPWGGGELQPSKDK